AREGPRRAWTPEATSSALDGVPGPEVSAMGASGRRLLAVCAAAVGVAVVPLGAWLLAERSPTDLGSPAARTTTEAEERSERTRSADEEWRWESFGGVEVQVPADWAYGTTGTPPCLQASDPARTPDGEDRRARP